MLEPKMCMMVLLKCLDSTNIFKAGSIEFIIHTLNNDLDRRHINPVPHPLKIVEYFVISFYKSKNVKTLILKIL